MPPANSPTDSPAPPRFLNLQADTRDPLNPRPYLEEIVDAISSPVPNLAATLSTPDRSPQRRPRTPQSQAQRIDNGGSITFRQSIPANNIMPYRAPDESRSEHEGRSITSGLAQTYASEQLRHSAEQNALERYRTEGMRSYLTEEEFQTWASDSRRRVMQRQSQPRRMSGIRDTSPHRYSTSGEPPQRQRLYDWAMSPREHQSVPQAQEEDEDMADYAWNTNVPRTANLDHPDSMSVHNQPEQETHTARRDPRTQLEQALSEYRRARNALRPSTGTNVPTASALRAYWNDESRNDTPPSAVNNERPRFALSEFVEQHRRQRHRMHMARMEEAQDAGWTPLADERREIEERRSTEERRTQARLDAATKVAGRLRARNMIRYLTNLRFSSTIESSLTLAKALRIDTLYSSREENAPSDLPLSLDDLPVPQRSSWLMPGMVWQGVQCAERDAERGAILASNRMRERQREYLRRAIERRRLGVTADAAALGAPGSISTLLDAERYMSDLLEDEDSTGLDRWERSSVSAMAEESRRERNEHASDNWPVKVTLHSVDYDSMTLTGTMSASHIPDRYSSNSKEHKDEGSNMESFFEGEIIDFRRNMLETEGRGYKAGGLEVDTKYWRGIGPLKLETQRKIPTNTPEVSKGSDNHATLEVQTEEDLDKIVSRCLGSRTWIQEKLGEEWILMRWKERCFTTPTRTTSTGSRPLPPINNTTSSSRPTIYTTSTTEFASWGLTISGFYYVALNRLTGEIDALYYDSGSQPYQSLRMVPEGLPTLPGKVGVEAVTRSVVTGGMRKWWPSLEFR